MLKLAEMEDLETVLNLSEQFLKTTYYKDLYNPEKVRYVLETLIESPAGVVIMMDDYGMLAGAASPFMFGLFDVASELGWWINPDKRKSGAGSVLLNAFEEWARRMNCKMITMISLDDEVSKYYEKMGYSLHERTYIKEI